MPFCAPDELDKWAPFVIAACEAEQAQAEVQALREEARRQRAIDEGR